MTAKAVFQELKKEPCVLELDEIGLFPATSCNPFAMQLSCGLLCLIPLKEVHKMLSRLEGKKILFCCIISSEKKIEEEEDCKLKTVLTSIFGGSSMPRLCDLKHRSILSPVHANIFRKKCIKLGPWSNSLQSTNHETPDACF